MVLRADPGLINAAGQDVHVTGLGFNRLLGEPRVAGGRAALGLGAARRRVCDPPRDLDRLGGWDESGFLYHEDVQLSWLLQLLGADVRVVPASIVVHDYHLTMHPTKLYLLERNRGGDGALQPPTPDLVGLAPLMALTEAMMWGYCLVRGSRFLQAKAPRTAGSSASLPRLRERRRFIRGAAAAL